jgi:hypothetical protein
MRVEALQVARKTLLARRVIPQSHLGSFARTLGVNSVAYRYRER